METAVPLTPWEQDPQDIACNFAYGTLIRMLPTSLAVKGRLHAETYMTAVGAIAGYTAQRTLFASSPPVPGVNIHLITTREGSNFWFGDALNCMLVPATEEMAYRCVWSNAAAGAVNAGLPREKIPDMHAMFRHVSQTIGGKDEGISSVAEKHQPHMRPKELLKLIWPRVAMIFDNPVPGGPPQIGKAPVRWWAAMAARASNQPIVDVRDVLAPEIALTLVMESAIYCSKLDQAVIEGV